MQICKLMFALTVSLALLYAAPAWCSTVKSSGDGFSNDLHITLTCSESYLECSTSNYPVYWTVTVGMDNSWTVSPDIILQGCNANSPQTTWQVDDFFNVSYGGEDTQISYELNSSGIYSKANGMIPSAPGAYNFKAGLVVTVGGSTQIVWSNTVPVNISVCQ